VCGWLKVPAFEGSNGVLLYTCNAIAYHVANDALRGTTTTDAAYIHQWMEFADSEILPAALTWVFPCMGIMQYNKQVSSYFSRNTNSRELIMIITRKHRKHIDMQTHAGSGNTLQ